MGRRRSKNSKGGKGGRRRKEAYDDIVFENDKFTAYYQGQKIAADEAEWKKMMEAFATQLPDTFRINEMCGFGDWIRKRLLDVEKSFDMTEPDDYQQQIAASVTAADEANAEAKAKFDAEAEAKKDGEPRTEFRPVAQPLRPWMTAADGRKLELPQPLSWYPNNNAWFFDANRRAMRKVPGALKYRQWLMQADSLGHINRQEAVSMIPPLLLDVQPHHKVLDMCASPGSKTAQLLCALHAAAPVGQEPLPRGFVVANDNDSKRAYLLVHQLKRLGSPDFLVTTHDGQEFPTLLEFDPVTQREIRVPNASGTGTHVKKIKFDRILADVPCSGDGTLRKNLGLWRSWSTGIGNGLHRLQVAIAWRGAQMLAAGGYMVYSTCSMNPIENEAVVAELVRRSQGRLEVVDVADRLPGLKREPGLSTWRVCMHDKFWYDSIDQVTEPRQVRKVRASMFAPTKDEARDMHLERCMRIMPHAQNTGGFFITLLKKTESFSNKDRKDEAATATEQSTTTSSSSSAAAAAATTTTTTTDSNNNNNNNSNKMDEGNDEDDDEVLENDSKFDPSNEFEQCRFQPLAKKDVQELVSFFGIREDFPLECLFVRSQEKNAKVYMLGRGLSACIGTSRLKIVHSGIKLFELHNAASRIDTKYRISQEGALLLESILTKQVITMPPELFKQLLSTKVVRADEMFVDKTLVETFSATRHGSVIVKCQPKDCPKPILAIGWRSAHKIDLMVSREQIQCSLSLLATFLPPAIGVKRKDNGSAADDDEQQHAAKKGKTTN